MQTNKLIIFCRWTNVLLGAVTFVLFLPGIFVEHNMAAKEWKALSSNMEAGQALPSPKWYTLVALMSVFFLHRVNITINER